MGILRIREKQPWHEYGKITLKEYIVPQKGRKWIAKNEEFKEAGGQNVGRTQETLGLISYLSLMRLETHETLNPLHKF